MTEINNLRWPEGWKRTIRPQKSRFDKSFVIVRRDLFDELRLLGATNIVLTSNLELRRDGLPYANQKQPEDTGVAVYFTREKKEQCIPCDKWNRVEDNIQAIVKTINALRGLERWGAKDMVDKAFQGFNALPHYSNIKPIITPYQYFSDCYTIEELKFKYKSKLKIMHPDVGGSSEDFIELQNQYKKKLEELS